jgi:alkylation response protein AidB-like acyl-CoA dehydrogenase
LIELSFDFDPNALKTTAKVDGNDYVLSGEKVFVPFAKDAEALIVYANLGGVTQGFIVPKDAAGLSISTEREKLMGLNALSMYRVKLEDVKIPASHRLGGASGHDFDLILSAMRIASAAAAVGVANSSFEYAKTQKNVMPSA